MDSLYGVTWSTPRPAHIHDMANILLSRRGSTNIQTVGINWVSTFILLNLCRLDARQ